MKVLAIGAHPDDIEIFMYGIISICKDRGDKIHLAIATDGSAGNVLGFPNLSKVRKTETMKALKVFGTPPPVINNPEPLDCILISVNSLNSLIESIVICLVGFFS